MRTKNRNDMESKNNECICLNCIYGSQPYGYFPIVCVHGKRIREMWDEKFNCKHFDKCPEPEESPSVRQTPFQVIVNNTDIIDNI